MATAAAPTAFATRPQASAQQRVVRREDIWQAPLVPVALAATAGIVLDRYGSIPLAFSLAACSAGIFAWIIASRGQPAALRLIYLWASVAAVAAAHHHWFHDTYPANDVGAFVSAEARPARVRGVIAEEPVYTPPAGDDPLRSIPRTEATRAVVELTSYHAEEGWRPISGRVRLFLSAQIPAMHIGDEVEVTGRLSAPMNPGNPGEFDYAGALGDQRIRAELRVHGVPGAVTRITEGWPRSFGGWLAVVRGWGQRQIQHALPAEQSGVAAALLLGENAAMASGDWDKYMRTGVIHVLAISGQHLVVLAGFLWLVIRLFGIGRRRGAWLVAGFLLGYALLTGGRPPVMRSAVMVLAYCGAIYLRRPALTANSFALGWLVVAALNPTDIFTGGCLLSFLAVAVLYWGTARWFWSAPKDPLDKLVEESRPLWQKILLRIGRMLAIAYGVNVAIWLAAAPLVAARYHLISPVGFVIGPPVILLTSIALLTGFFLLLSAAVCWPLVPVFAWLTHWSLAGCDGLVHVGSVSPGAYWYVSDIPGWWLWVFYPGLLAALTLKPLQGRWRWAVTAGLAWLCVGLVGGAAGTTPGEFRCTFLAVGHGGCTVLEMPDGRTLLYDAGAMGDPEVSRRIIAPYLWHRGIRRVDEVFLSHADLDHFNGLPALLERFAVGQVTCTPTFSDKPSPGVPITLEAIRRRSIPIRIVRAGDRLRAGDVEMEVLHPPPAGPEGNENTRSLILLVHFAEHSILLTGDLEGPGLQRVLGLPPISVDVLMAPHHGSRTANTPELAAWARPRVVISSQGPPRWPPRGANSYKIAGAAYLETWREGAVTIRRAGDDLLIETHRTGQRLFLSNRQQEP